MSALSPRPSTDGDAAIHDAESSVYWRFSLLLTDADPRSSRGFPSPADSRERSLLLEQVVPLRVLLPFPQDIGAAGDDPEPFGTRIRHQPLDQCQPDPPATEGVRHARVIRADQLFAGVGIDELAFAINTVELGDIAPSALPVLTGDLDVGCHDVSPDDGAQRARYIASPRPRRVGSAPTDHGGVKREAIIPRKTPERVKATSQKAASPPASIREASIRAGIGGWTFEPWRGEFYPKGLPHAKELGYASTHLSTIEINGTFYRTQTPATYAKWASETPDGFVFAVKGPRYAVNRGVLAEAGDSIRRFFESGVTALGDRLGPILWQFAPTKKFDEADFGAFLELLPKSFDGRALRHVVEVRHDSFCTPAFVAFISRFEIPVVFAEHAKYPAIADLTGDFVYARLQKGQDDIKTAYPPKALDQWAERARVWAAGEMPADLAYADPSRKPKVRPREVFIYFIHEGKVRAPAAAMALIERLGR